MVNPYNRYLQSTPVRLERALARLEEAQGSESPERVSSLKRFS